MQHCDPRNCWHLQCGDIRSCVIRHFCIIRPKLGPAPHLLTQPPASPPSPRRDLLSDCQTWRRHVSSSNIYTNFAAYPLQTVCAKPHCNFLKVSMFEYNFNFVETFLIWCFQDFTKSKFIQMNFIYLKHEFFNIWIFWETWFSNIWKTEAKLSGSIKMR